MTLQISGKNVDIGEALRAHIEGRVSEAVAKYFGGGFDGHVVLEREGSGFRAEGTVHLDSGVVLQATGRAHEAYACFDQAAERIEKRLRRYKRRLKDHHRAGESEEWAAQSYVIEAPAEDGEIPADFKPVVVAETAQRLRTMTVGMAVMELDLTGAPVVMFRNAGTGEFSVVFRRSDGNIGWIDPSLAGTKPSS
jgi:ribosomal subunit interface protein